VSWTWLLPSCALGRPRGLDCRLKCDIRLVSSAIPTTTAVMDQISARNDLVVINSVSSWVPVLMLPCSPILKRGQS